MNTPSMNIGYLCDLVNHKKKKKNVSHKIIKTQTRLLYYNYSTRNVEHCGGEPEQAANMHMNRLSFTLKR